MHNLHLKEHLHHEYSIMQKVVGLKILSVLSYMASQEFMLKLSVLACHLSCLSVFESMFAHLTSLTAETLGRSRQKHTEIGQKGC